MNILLFTSPACHRCNDLKEKLEAKDIPFQESYDIKKLKEYAPTAKSMPVLVVNDEWVEDWEKFINQQ